MRRIGLYGGALALAAAVAAAVAMASGGCGETKTMGAVDMGAGGPPTPPPAYVETMGVMGAPKLDCLGSRTDPAAPTEDQVLAGTVKDFQDGLPIQGAVVSVYLDAASVTAHTPVTSSAPTDKDGNYSVVIPKGHYRVILGNSGGKAVKGGVPVDSIPTYEFDRPYTDKSRNAVLVTTRDAIPGLVSVQPDVTQGVVAGTVRDCAGTELGGAQVTVTASGYDSFGNTFYFRNVNGSPLPTRLQMWTSGVGVFAALNVPPGNVEVSVRAVVGSGAPRAFGKATIPVLPGAITIADILPAGK